VTSPLLILFSLAARRKLRQRCTRAAATNPNAIQAAMNEIEKTLQVVFPHGSAAIVQDVYVGYQPREGEYILHVELTGAKAADGLYVVKLGPADRLERELKGWEQCRPDGLRHDLVLTTLEPCYHPEIHQLIALVYADAEQFIGVDETLSLETALLDSFRLGVPTPESVADVLFALYERLGLLLYRHSFTDDPKVPVQPLTPEFLDKKWADNMTAWAAKSGPAFDIKAVANSAAHDAGLTEQFLDPYRFAKHVGRNLTEAFVPRLRRGYAHGDLHGRNVLVGRVEDRVLWPAVFDYADMGTRNLIGWDFVKMETEFKLRAYPDVFPGRQQSFVGRVIPFERELHQRTEECREANQWPEAPADSTQRERLRWLVLMIRRNASRHLGHYAIRPGEWLAEYYFLLAIYGLNSGHFDNLTDIQRLGAYLSAGCAASRYLGLRAQQPTQGVAQ
jgi:hypothetical protein